MAFLLDHDSVYAAISFPTLINTAPVRDLLGKRQFLRIVDDPERFWELFAVHAVHEGDHQWTVTGLPGERVKIEAPDHVRTAVKDSLEKIRPLFAKCIRGRGESSGSLVNRGGDYFYLAPDQIRIPIGTETEMIARHEVHFPLYWRGSLPKMAEAVGLNFTAVADRVLKPVPYGQIVVIPHAREEIVLSPKKEYYLDFPIPCRDIKTENPFNDATFYRYFLAGKFLDFTISSAIDAGTCQVHKMAFYHNGGEVVQKMLDGPWMESASNTLQLPYSSGTIRQFVDYVYLGAEAYFDKMAVSMDRARAEASSGAPAAGGGGAAAAAAGGAGREDEATASEEIDLYELLEMAAFYSLHPLRDICTNLISCMVKKSDSGTIEELAGRLGNEHLTLLVAYLKTL